MSAQPVDLHICITCKRDGAHVGEVLYRTLQDLLNVDIQRLSQLGYITLHPVACMSVCTRPCTVALCAPGKWTYIVGDLDAANDAQTLLEYAKIYAASAHGTPPLKVRPAAIRRGTVARLPPSVYKDPYAKQ